MEHEGPGYDDWFDEPEPPTQEASRGGHGVYEEGDDVWVLPEDEARRRRAGDGEIVVLGVAMTRTQAAIVAAAVLAIFFGILAAAGVFNGKAAVLPTLSTQTLPPVTHPTTSTPTTPLVVAPSQPLKPGDTGKQVKILQRALNALDFKVGKPDGVYGPNTQSAVEQFQSSKGLTTDGIVGQQTLTALQQALGG
jgi:sulfite reductase alpha subunit-like flavoprotein